MPQNTLIDPRTLAPNHIEIDLGALTHNFRHLSKHVAPARIMCVLKANAYGHGLVECAQHLEKIGAPYFCVAQLQEGVELRQAGIRAPILVFGGILNDQIEYFINYNLDITTSSIEKLKAIEAAAIKLKKSARIQLKIDTGMGRIGVRTESIDQLFNQAIKTGSCTITGVFSHFAKADEEDPEFTLQQLDKFNKALKFFTENNYPMPARHIANSAGIIRSKEFHLDFVRPGLALYGVYPAPFLKQMGVTLTPIQSLKSKVVYFKVVSAGQGISYGHSWVASKDTRIATIPMGYGDGYMRVLSNKASVLIHGKRYPIVGNICMDQLMVDISEDDAYNGEEVTLVGTQGNDRITVEELATLACTVPHEILTSLGARLQRRYLLNGT